MKKTAGRGHTPPQVQLMLHVPGESLAGPPPPPHVPASVRFTMRQWLGMPVLLAIPLLALTGVFGTTTRTEHARSASLDVTVEYASRLHYRQSAPFTITVRNAGASRADTITVAADPAFMRAFGGVRIAGFARDAYSGVLTGVAPGESRTLGGDVDGLRTGRHAGEVVVTKGSDTVRVPVSTFVFP